MHGRKCHLGHFSYRKTKWGKANCETKPEQNTNQNDFLRWTSQLDYIMWKHPNANQTWLILSGYFCYTEQIKITLSHFLSHWFSCASCRVDHVFIDVAEWGGARRWRRLYGEKLFLLQLVNNRWTLRITWLLEWSQCPRFCHLFSDIEGYLCKAIHVLDFHSQRFYSVSGEHREGLFFCYFGIGFGQEMLLLFSALRADCVSVALGGGVSDRKFDGREGFGILETHVAVLFGVCHQHRSSTHTSVERGFF